MKRALGLLKWVLAIFGILLAVAAVVLPLLILGVFAYASDPDLKFIEIVGLLAVYWAPPIAIIIFVFIVVRWRVSRRRKSRESGSEVENGPANNMGE